MKQILDILKSRLMIVALFMLLQIAAIISVLVFFQNQMEYFYAFFMFVSVSTVIYIINKDGEPEYKLAWIIPIVILPLFGTPLYFIFGKPSRIPKKIQKHIDYIEACAAEALAGLKVTEEDLKELSKDAQLQTEYLDKIAKAPLFRHSETEFLPLGEIMFENMLEEIEKAEKYIFLEYFIIEDGYMWETLLNALERKAKAGVEVRLIYDDIGCITKLEKDYPTYLAKRGIKCHVFSRFRPVLTGLFNNRNHRKILAIDGKVAFTGGINIADEYINHIERFGHWLDCGVMIRGYAAYGFAVQFLTMWNTIRHSKEDFMEFMPEDFGDIKEDGFVQPFSDTPHDFEDVGEDSYLNMICRAKDYVYICTPYLVIDSKIITALSRAAKSGVDVRIVTPGIPDKAYVYEVTRSYYATLISAGVKIYEYTPGFIHSKTCVSDDEFAICGTINFDYRSLYLHHECAAWMYKTNAVMQMKEDFLYTLTKSEEITLKSTKRNIVIRCVQSILRVFAPMM